MADGFNNPVFGGDGSLVRNQIKSPDYVAQTTGWQLAKNGNADLNSVTLRGELDVFGNNGSFLKLQNQTVSPGLIVPVIRLQPGNYSDSFLPLPADGQILAESTAFPGGHSASLAIFAPAYNSQLVYIQIQGNTQESVTDDSTISMIAANVNIASGNGTIGLFGTVELNGTFATPYFAGTLSNVNIPNNAASPAALSIASAQKNTGNQWSSGTDVVINVAGTYEAGINLDFAANATGIRQARISVNGSAYKAWNAPAISGFETTVGGSIKIPGLNVNDVVTFRAYQNSGGVLALTGFNECWLKWEMQ